ncbi:unnamed protein product, partial [Sphacelaria rigidula]
RVSAAIHIAAAWRGLACRRKWCTARRGIVALQAICRGKAARALAREAKADSEGQLCGSKSNGPLPVPARDGGGGTVLSKSAGLSVGPSKREARKAARATKAPTSRQTARQGRKCRKAAAQRVLAATEGPLAKIGAVRESAVMGTAGEESGVMQTEKATAGAASAARVSTKKLTRSTVKGDDADGGKRGAAAAGPSWQSLLSKLQTRKGIGAADGSELPPTKQLPPRGIVNTGNNCYRTAVLQAMLASVPFRR